MSEQQRARSFRSLLRRWHYDHRRILPWRRTRNPYRVLISEVMLQQTQVGRVQRKYGEFLKRFPTVSKLARASAASVIRGWRGMGYNSRALRLRKLARHVVENHAGRIPNGVNDLMTLPGVGRYTAHAVACFAFNKRVPVVDVNVGRVISRVFWRTPSPGAKDISATWSLARSILPATDVHRWHEALMDLGATICTARKPRCRDCPVAEACASYPFLSRSTAPMSVRRSQEPLYDGLPVRIYRGRVVERLRGISSRGSIETRRLGRLVRPGISASHWPWFASVLNGLQADGMIELHARRKRVFARLPRG